MAVIMTVHRLVIPQHKRHTRRRPPGVTQYVMFVEVVTPWSPNIYDIISFDDGSCGELVYRINHFGRLSRDDDGVAVVRT